MTESPLTSAAAIQKSFSMALHASGLQAGLIIYIKEISSNLYLSDDLMYRLLQLRKNPNQTKKSSNEPKAALQLKNSIWSRSDF